MEEEMEELYAEGLATHGDPESCVDDLRGRGEALTGARAGRAIEPRNGNPGCPRCLNGGRQHWRRRYARVAGGPRAVGEPGHVRNLHARAPGVDGVTWESYGQDLVANLRDLHERVQQGRYRASPSRRVYIPKADGRQRPLGIATLEDKIVQRAVVEVLNAVYEADFRGFSYGFRPGRGPHQALVALAVGIGRRPAAPRTARARIA